MPRRVEFEGTIHEFPDNATDDQIRTALSGSKPAAQAKSLGGFVNNALSSAGDFVSDAAHAVTHPVDTLVGAGKAITGGMQRGLEAVGFPKPLEEQGGQRTTTPEFDAVSSHLHSRYGGFDKVAETMYRDPVGFLADLSLALGGAGGGADAAKLGKVAKVAKVASEFTDPIKLAGKAADASGATALAQRGAEATSKALTRGALRGGMQPIGNVKDPDKIAAITRTNEHAVSEMNRQNLPLSEQGIKDLNDGLITLRQQQKAVIGPGVRIDPATVETHLDDVLHDREWQVNPNTDVKQVEQVRQNFRQRTGGVPMRETVQGKPVLFDNSGKPVAFETKAGKPIRDPNTGVRWYTQGEPIPAAEAQALKEGTYRNNKYGAEVPPQLVATAETEKGLAHGLMVELEQQFPQLGVINPDIAKKIDLQGVLAKAVAKHTQDGGFWGNLAKQTVSKEGGLKLGGLGAAGYYSGHPEAAAAVALMQAVLSDPAVKQRLAIAINKAQYVNPSKYGLPSMATAVSRVDEYLKKLQ